MVVLYKRKKRVFNSKNLITNRTQPASIFAMSPDKLKRLPRSVVGSSIVVLQTAELKTKAKSREKNFRRVPSHSHQQ